MYGSFKAKSLPLGWEELRAEDGQSFFVEYEPDVHINKRTTWIDPRDNARRERVPEELPYGWGEAWDPRIGRYFVDHINKVTTRKDPRVYFLGNSRHRTPSVSSHEEDHAWGMGAAQYPEEDGDQRSHTSHISHASHNSHNSQNSRASHLSAYSDHFAADLAASTGESKRSSTLSQNSLWQTYALQGRRTPSVAEKLREIQQEFENNHMVLEKMQDDIRQVLEMLEVPQAALRRVPISASSPQVQFSAVLRELDEHRTETMKRLSHPSSLQEASDLTKKFNIEDHLYRLQGFIKEQYSQVEALRRLYTALMADGIPLKDKLERIDNAAYCAFVRLHSPSPRDDEEYQTKVAYFDKLVASVSLESMSRPLNM